MTPKRYNTIGEYLKDVPLTHRAGLKKLYAQIKKHYPNATEHISYNKPLFKLHGHPLVGFQATKHHSSLFVWSGTALKTLGKMLEKYDTSMSTIRFAPNASLPDRIVKAVLKTREKEIVERWGKKKKK